MPNTTFDRVREFHETFGHPVNTELTTPDAKTAKLRLNLILEEASELIEAVERSRYNGLLSMARQRIAAAQKNIESAGDEEFCIDHVEVADALGDLDYVVNGAAHTFGIPMHAVGDEIHASNMSKAGEDGQPIYNDAGKIMKGPNYFKPDLARVLSAVNTPEFKTTYQLDAAWDLDLEDQP